MVSLEDIAIDTKIDPNNLDLEWREQAHLFQKYTNAHGRALRKKERLYAELDKAFREYPNGKDNKKALSETAIKAMIDTDPEYIKVCYIAFRWSGCVKAMDQKRIALENLVKLGGMNYFSMPKESRPLDREFFKNVVEDDVREKIKSKLMLVEKKSREECL